MKLETQKKSSYSKNPYLLYGKGYTQTPLFRKEYKSGRGYTLIETLVAVGIFSIAIAIATSFFVSSLKSQDRALNIRETIDNASHVMEYISRALRMARKELGAPPVCLSSYGLNYEKYEETDYRILDGITYWGPGIKFINHNDECQEFFLDTNDKRLKESKNEVVPLPLTSEDLEVTQFQFQLSGKDQTDNFQPRVTMLFEIAKRGGTGLPKIKTQTTVSQRNLDIMR